ncbi:eukaryotic translation initiation factor 4E-1-like [Salvia hispanica]|uniref:eukaryotic translation initiation factor 4E-1-like n=1 Tax=Salvia hispanica TaxID=49212 RepID=UPI002009AFEE|nr:eukaryotic translation initiation factor 4E-1-like [Salvia hispanica]
MNAAAEAMPPLPTTHPLEHSWTLWLDHPIKNSNKAWRRQINTFSTVEDLWSVYKVKHSPSNLGFESLYCFKHGIEPKREHPICAKGGKWTVTYSHNNDDFWLYTMLAMIGEQFHYGDEICGAVVNIRETHEEIALWTKNAANEDFQDDAKKFGRGAKYRYTV